MKRFLLLGIGLWLIAGSSFGQTVAHSDPVNDQLLQGPCFIFAAVAALESKAIQAGWPVSTDFYEWNLYSHEVLGSDGPSGTIMFEKVMNQARTNGILRDEALYRPATEAGLPNPDENGLAGLAKWQAGCTGLTTGSYSLEAGGNCNEVESPNRDFIISSFGGRKFIYETGAGSGYVQTNAVDAATTEDDIIAQLNAGNGVVAYIQNYDGDGPGVGDPPTFHAVFIYGKEGANYQFKDSWPGATQDKDEPLPMAQIYRYFYLTGSIAGPCSAEIAGPATISGTTVYQLAGNDTYKNIQWNIPNEVSQVALSKDKRTLTVRPTGCFPSGGVVQVNYEVEGIACYTTLAVNVAPPASQVPDGINVLSLDWDNGQTCPNTVLELEVDDPHNLPYPSTVYQWSIAGATLQSSNGLPTVFVNTGSGNLTFKVRANYNNCGYSGWETLYGNTNAPGCGGGLGGGGMFRATVQHEVLELRSLTDLPEHLASFDYQLLTLDGRTVKQGNIRREDLSVELTGIDERMMVLFLVSTDGTYVDQLKIVR
ncbi:MAG: hypothetical protein AAFQ98_07290 [Bacteroidota bacterium]